MTIPFAFLGTFAVVVLVIVALALIGFIGIIKRIGGGPPEP